MLNYMFGLWISVAINGEQWESVPAVFDTYKECQDYSKLYIGIVSDMGCYKGTFVLVEQEGN